MTKTAFAIGEVVAIGQRITRLEGEITNLNADKAEIYREARGNGFDVKALKKAIKKWQRLQDDPQAEQEAAALEDLYLAALTGQDGAETAQDRISVAGNGLPKSPTRARTSDTPETPANGGGMAAGQEPLKSIAPAALTNAQPADIPAPESKEQEAPAASAVYPHCELAAPFPDLPAFLDRRKTAQVSA